jgi:hypothetical protein
MASNNIVDKLCKKCNSTKPISEFYKGRCCKECTKERIRGYYKKNRDKIRAKGKDPEFKKRKRELHAYKMLNDPEYKARYSAKRKRCRDKYKDKIRAYNLAYIKKNTEVRRAKKKAKRLTPEYKAQEREYNLKQKTNLTDVYVRRQLAKRTSLKVADIPQALVEAKRIQLKIKELVNEKR